MFSVEPDVQKQGWTKISTNGTSGLVPTGILQTIPDKRPLPTAPKRDGLPISGRMSPPGQNVDSPQKPVIPKFDLSKKHDAHEDPNGTAECSNVSKNST